MRFLLILAAAWLWVAPLAAQTTAPGIPPHYGIEAGHQFPPQSGGGGLSLDGSGEGNTVVGAGPSTIAVSLATTKGSGQIVVFVATNAASITSVTATGLTFNARKPYTSTFGFSGIAEYVANYTTNFSGTITVTIPTSSTTTVDAFGIGGANTTSGIGAPPFDSNPSLPASTVNTTSSVSTSNATDFIFGFCSLSGATDTASGTWTTLPGSGSNNALTEYQIVSATQSSLAMTTTGGSCNGSIADAIVH